MNRRGFLRNLGIAAPVVITTPGLLMPVRSLIDRADANALLARGIPLRNMTFDMRSALILQPNSIVNGCRFTYHGDYGPHMIWAGDANGSVVTQSVFTDAGYYSPGLR